MKLKEARLAAGLSQQQMSDLMHIPKATIANWEQEIRTPPVYVKRFILKELAEIERSKRLKPTEQLA